MAHSYRRTTIKVTFQAEHPRPRAHQIEEFIREDLRLKPQEVIGINFSITGSNVYIKMTSEAACADVVRQHAQGLKFKHSDGHIGEVTVDHAGFGLRTLRIFELPFEVPQDVVVEAFRPYGKVLGHLAEKWQTFTTYQVLNGVRQIKIELSKHVPSYLMIGGVRAIVMYDGQPRTCAGCGQEGHVRSDCLRRRLLQIQTEDATPAAKNTPLPSTYAAAVLNKEASSQDTPVFPPPLPPENNTVHGTSPDTSPTPAVEPTTPLSSTENPPELMDLDLRAVPTSAFVQTGTTSDDGRSHSDTEQHVRKQRSPRKRKKRNQTPTDDATLHKALQAEEPMSDSDLSPSATTTEAFTSVALTEERSQQTTLNLVAGRPPDDTVTEASPLAPEGSGSHPHSVSGSWAADVEARSDQDEGPPVGESPTMKPDTGST